MKPDLSTATDVDLRGHVRPGDTVLWAQATGEPVALTSRLFDQRYDIGRFRCFLGLSLPDAPRPEPNDGVDMSGYCALGTNRTFSAAGALDVLVSHYSQLPELFRSRRFPIDVVLLLLPPADDDGTHSLGLVDEYVSAAIHGARTVIAEVNPNVPRTSSGRRVAAVDLELVVNSDRPLLEFAAGEPTDVELRIARHVADLVPDGATLQFGLGSLPIAILEALDDHTDLGVHSGMIGDAVTDLMEAGTITNVRKPVDPGVTVCGLVMGTQRLFDFVDSNPVIEVRDTAYTHDIELLGQLPAFTAINSAVQVDLSGAVNAEAIGGQYVGAMGGAADFLRGAHRSPGGLPIIALPSTANRHSRIVARLDGPVSTSRADAGLIVTEHGVADLRGCTIMQRVERMLTIVDPDHRQGLETEAETLLSTGG